MDRGMLFSRGGVVAGAYLVDRLIGDPVRPTHPARLMGRGICFYESLARPLPGWLVGRLRMPAGPGSSVLPSRAWERGAGIALAAGLPLLSYRLTRRVLAALPRPLRLLGETWLLSTALAGRDLGEHARRVERGLERSLEEGRQSVSMIVGRETASLSEGEVVRATVETVAENTSDGLVAPLVYGFAGGAPLALAFKAVSTLDSMVGYRNERYRDFGWASARLDDLSNLLPARLTALLATAVGRRGPRAVLRWWEDRIHHASPNAGLVEAAFAQSLQVRLGGGATYGGRFVPRQPVGAEFPPPERCDIERAVSLSEDVGRLALVAGLGSLVLLSWMSRSAPAGEARR